MENMKKENKKLIGFLWGIFCAVLFIIDRATKVYMLENLKPVVNKPFIKGFMDFTFVENRGAAFGILEGKIGFFVLLTVVIGIVIVYFVRKLILKGKYPSVVFSLMLILSGAVGNLYDRIKYEYVVDFFEFTFINFPVFNVADIYVVVGTIIFIIMLLFGMKEDF